MKETGRCKDRFGSSKFISTFVVTFLRVKDFGKDFTGVDAGQGGRGHSHIHM